MGTSFIITFDGFSTALEDTFKAFPKVMMGRCFSLLRLAVLAKLIWNTTAVE